MQYSIIHPSRSRADIAKETIKIWLGNAKNPQDIEYILSVDINDPQLSRYKKLSAELGIKTHVAMNKSAIEAINRAAKKTTGRILVVVSDDFLCEPDWDVKLLKELEGKEDFIVKTQDGIQDWIITLPVLDRKYYERFGYVYFPEFHHLWVDAELFCVAWMTDKIIMSDLLFEHQHYSTGKSEKDAINNKNDKTWSQGQKLFNKRKAINFGLPAEWIKKEFPYFAGFKK